MRTMVARACVHSSALYLSGVWSELSSAQTARIGPAFYRPFRIIVGIHEPGPQCWSDTSNAAICKELGVPILEWCIVVSRLRIAAKLSRRPADFASALHQGPGGAAWRLAVQNAYAALARLLPDKLASLPDTRASMAEWESCWSLAGAAWSALLRLALARAATDPW